MGARSSKSGRTSVSGSSPLTVSTWTSARVALAAPRLPGGAGDLVAVAQLAAADLRRGDVDVAVGRGEAADPQEA